VPKHTPSQNNVTEERRRWWQEAEIAASRGRFPRARRFLRWVLVAEPDDEEAWLRLARLASSQAAQLVYLRKAYAFHPSSSRVQAALRQARAQQLESTIGPLAPRPIGIRRLPVRTKDRIRWSKSRWLRFFTHAALGRVRSLASRRTLARLAGSLPVWSAFLLPLLVYLLTACSTVYNLDSAEFSAAAHTLGLVRATGYPLYLLLGKAFSLLLPFGDVGFRLNVMSGACAAGTVVFLYHLLRRLIRQQAAALAASLLFAFSYYFWAQAVVAEVYTLHTLLLAALLLMLLHWETSRSDGLLAVFGLLYGLSLANHMGAILLAPGLATFLLIVAGRELWRPKRILLLLVPFVAGLGTYLYIPLRYLDNPAFNYVGHYDATGRFIPLNLTRISNVWWLISGQGFRNLMFGYTLAELPGQVGQAAHWLWGNFLGIGLIPGLLGIWSQARNKPRYLALLGLIFVTNSIFFINYRVVDKAAMFVPSYLVWIVWVGEGYAWLIRWVQGWRREERRPSPVWAWGLVALAAVALTVNWPLVNVRHDTRARDRAHAALREASPNAIIFGWWTSAPPMHYLQLVEEQRPDVLVINRFLIDADEMYALIDLSLGQRPVYVMELDEGLIGAYQPVPVGPMFQLTPRERAEAGP
jgi:hypothetical protein